MKYRELLEKYNYIFYHVQSTRFEQPVNSITEFAPIKGFLCVETLLVSTIFSPSGLSESIFHRFDYVNLLQLTAVI